MNRCSRSRIFCHFMILGVACLLLAVPGFSQGIATGSISGTLTDPSGAAVPGATVTATSAATGVSSSAQSNDVGFFAIRSLPPGSYKIVIQAKNFRTITLPATDVAVSRDTALGGIKLELGQMAGESIVVEGGTPLIETSTAQVTTTFNTKATTDLPLNGGFDMLTLMVPGVADSGSNNFSNTNGAGFSANGLRGRSNNFEIDGQANNDNSVAGPSIFLGNQDALDEVSVVTNNFGVEYGHASGTVVNYVTKSGTNDFHGSGFEYWTGSRWDSHDNLETSSDTIPRFVENRFGGTIGGPIKHNKAWFFFSPYFDRVRSAGSPSTSGTSLTPTPNGLTQLVAAFGSGNPGVAALQAIGPYAVAAGNPHPLTTTTLNVTDGTTVAPIEFAPVERNVPSLFNDREFTGRVDVQLTNKDRVSARYIFQQNIDTGATGSFASGGWVDIPARDQQIALDWSRNFTNTIVNQLRYSFSRAGFGFEGGSFPDCTRATIDQCPTSIGFSSASLVGFGIANNLPQGRTINNTQVQDNGSILHGKHTFKFGGEFIKQRSPNTFLPNTNGTFTFSGTNTGGSCTTQFPGLTLDANNTIAGQQCGFSRFLSNTTSTFSMTDGSPKLNFREYDLAFYFGDDWRVKDNLTINLGLRWDYASQAINVLHDESVKQQEGSDPFWDTSLPESITTVQKVPNQYKYFGPNIGFAWNPHVFGMTGDKTVVRGGFRITYDPEYYNIFLNVASAAPFVNAGSLAGAACTAPCLPSSGFLGTDIRAAHLSDIPRGVNPGTRNYTTVGDDFHEPYTEGWSLGVQHELTSRMVLEVRYVGNHVVGNFQTINANPSLTGLVANGFGSLIPAGIAPCSTAGAPGFATGRADCDFTNIRNRENTGWSNYNGLQNELRIRNWHGLSASFSYTFSKTLDNSSEIFSTFSGGTTVAGAQNPYDISSAEKAMSGLDFPNLASIYFIYELPFFKSQQGFLGRALGGWQASGTWHYSSGQLWTPGEFAGDNSSCQTAFDNSFFGGASTCRPFMGNPSAPVSTVGQCTDPSLSDCGLVNFYTGAPTTASAVRWIFNDDVSAAFFGTPYGNAPRNPGIRGQAVNATNFSLFKNIKLNERFAIRLEAQVYNLFNHRFTGVPDPFIEDGNFQDAGGSFANTFFNSSGGDYTNTTNTGLGRRRMILGAHFTF